MEDFEAFARLITALQPWLGQLVLVGGWAHRLHRFHERAHPPAYVPLRTRDADLAFGTGQTLAGDLRAALAAAGFSEEPLGDDAPPAMHYHLGQEDAGFYAEFLTPLVGSGITRRGTPDTTVRKAGIVAQKVRHLELLLVGPWVVRVSPAHGVPVATALDVLVPNPTSFIVQKLLIHADRPPAKRAQDLLYVHDTLELFGPALDELHRLWRQVVRPQMHATTAKKAEAVARQAFAEMTDTLRRTALIRPDRRLSPENVRRACEYGLGEILGLP